MRRRAPHQEQVFDSSREGLMAELTHNPRLCTTCGMAESKYKCLWMQESYCCGECQRRAWREQHKKICAKQLKGTLKEKVEDLSRSDKDVAAAQLDVGEVHHQRGRFKEAEECFKRALHIYIALEGSNGVHAGALSGLLGNLYKDMGRYDEALEMVQDLLRILPPGCAKAGEALTTISSCFRHQGKFDKALAACEEALSIFQETLGRESLHVAATKENIAIIHFNLGQKDKTMKMLRESMRIKVLTCGSDSKEVATSHCNVGCLLMDMGLFDEARVSYETSLGIYRRVHGENHADVADMLYNLGCLLVKSEQQEEGLKLHKKALKIRGNLVAANHCDLCDSFFAIGHICHGINRHAEAIKAFDRAFEMVDPSNTSGLYSVGDYPLCHHMNAECKVDTGDTEGALGSAKKAVEAYTSLGLQDCGPARAAARLMREIEVKALLLGRDKRLGPRLAYANFF